MTCGTQDGDDLRSGVSTQRPLDQESGQKLNMPALAHGRGGESQNCLFLGIPVTHGLLLSVCGARVKRNFDEIRDFLFSGEQPVSQLVGGHGPLGSVDPEGAEADVAGGITFGRVDTVE